MENNKDRLISKNIKIALYGDSGVGKTAVALRWGTDTFHETYQATLGADFESKTIVNADLGLSLDLQIWDIDGQEKFATMLPFYFHETQWVVLVFSVTDRNSFDNLPNYFSNARRHADPNAQYVILANKIDLESARQVDFAEAKAFSRAQHAIYIETSAKNSTGLHKLEQKILKFTAHPRLKTEGVRAPDPSLSVFGGKCKQEGFGEEKITCARPDAIAVVRSAGLFVSAAKTPTSTAVSNPEAKLTY
jgi:small GTP-binding protein